MRRTREISSAYAYGCYLDCFTHAGGKQARTPELKRNLIAVLLAHSTNLGLTRMADACGISYDVLAWTSEWYVREETLSGSNLAIIDYHQRLPLTEVFGTGTHRALFDDDPADVYVSWHAEWGIRDGSVGTEDSSEDLAELVTAIVEDLRRMAQRYTVRVEWSIDGDPPEGSTIEAEIATLGVELPTEVLA